MSRELSIGEILSRTFELYRNNFTSFVLLFAVIEAVIGVLNWLASTLVTMPVAPTNPTLGQTLSYFSSFLGAFAITILVSFVVSVVFLPVAEGATIKMASEEITGTKIGLMGGVRYAFSKLLSLWVLSIIVGIVVFLGFIALIVPGIILVIMFSLALPALLIENVGVFDSMRRSRQLVSHRWLKTFAVVIVLAIIIGIVELILNTISLVAGPGSGILGSILSALYQPVIPIFLSVYYYSNVARTTPAAASPAPTTAPPTAGASFTGMKFCPSCGTQMPSSAAFCPKCGASQPA
jgi:hypothetical protein